MNPRVKEASKKMSGSLKSLDVAPAQRTIAEASQAAKNTYAGVAADFSAVVCCSWM